MRSQKIVVVGASAGGVDALMQIAAKLPRDLAAPIFVVLHIPADSPSLLPQVLARRGKLAAQHGEDGLRENRMRPAIDPLFRSAAVAAGSNTIAVVLTGSLDDGTAGMIAIKEQGGYAIVQDPGDAMYPAMPQSAIEHVEDVDEVVPLDQIADAIVRAVGHNARRQEPDTTPRSELMKMENRISHMESMHDDNRPGRPSMYSCPECGGVLNEISEGDFVRYRCQVGHAYSPETMLGAQTDLIEEALWSALKTLEENARLSRRLAATERERGHEWMAKRFDEREEDARKRTEVIRQFLLSQTGTAPVEAEASKTH